jgi:adenosylcobinamide-phosphate synthase
LGVIFKAVSTLDSMVGYRNEKYEDLGCASAKMDDVLNYLPARITGFLIVAAAGILGMDVKNSYRILIRDHANHKSPNCAWSESAVAGALGIQLGGTHLYFGKEVYKPTIGDNDCAVAPKDIARTNKLMYMTSLLALCLLAPIAYSLFFL